MYIDGYRETLCVHIYVCIIQYYCTVRAYRLVFAYTFLRCYRTFKKKEKKSSVRNNINIFSEKTIIMCTYWQYIYLSSDNFVYVLAYLVDYRADGVIVIPLYRRHEYG